VCSSNTSAHDRPDHMVSIWLICTRSRELRHSRAKFSTTRLKVLTVFDNNNNSRYAKTIVVYYYYYYYSAVVIPASELQRDNTNGANAKADSNKNSDTNTCFVTHQIIINVWTRELLAIYESRHKTTPTKNDYLSYLPRVERRRIRVDRTRGSGGTTRRTRRRTGVTLRPVRPPGK